MAPCTHPGMKKLICPKGKKRPRLLRSLGLASLLVERYMRQGAARIAVGRVRSKKYEEKKTGKKNEKNPPHPKHATKSTAAWRPRPTRDGSRPNTYTRYPILARFLHRSRVCRNQPRLYTYVPALLLLRRLYSFWCSIFSPAQLLLSLL